jgi:site-specific DNA recombinase
LVALPDFLANHAPSGDETLFVGAKRLPPGHTLVSEDGRITLHRYWDLAIADALSGPAPGSAPEREALEGYARGRFQLQAEVKRFLESRPEFPKAASESVRNQNVTNILVRSVYAGFVEARNWGVTLRKGHHEPLISAETYRKIQERMTGAARVPARKDISDDFPLRGFVRCGDCGSPMTACWSTGRWKNRFPYYLCAKTGCASYRKSIRRQNLEGEFGELLEKLTPSTKLLGAARAVFEEFWHRRLDTLDAQAEVYKTQLIVVERKVEQFLDRIADSDVPAIVKTYEDRIRILEAEKAALHEKIARVGRPMKAFGETLRTALEFLASPYKHWISGRLESQRTVLKLTFTERVSYLRNEGFRTPSFYFPFRVLADVSAGQIEMASPRGFEPLLPP